MTSEKEPSFDPYHKWLAIPKTQRPPTLYQLLGLAQGESDAEVIEEAVIRQTTHVRAYQVGPHAEACTRILNEISKAEQILRNPQKRVEYDRRLALAAEARAAALERSEPAKPVAPTIESAFAGFESDATTAPPPPRRGPAKADAEAVAREVKKKGPSQGVLLVAAAGVGAAVLAIVGIVVYAMSGPPAPPRPTHAPGPIAENKTAPKTPIAVPIPKSPDIEPPRPIDPPIAKNPAPREPTPKEPTPKEPVELPPGPGATPARRTRPFRRGRRCRRPPPTSVGKKSRSPTIPDPSCRTPVVPPPMPMPVVPTPKAEPVPVAKDPLPAIKPNPANPFPAIPESVPSLRPLAELSHRMFGHAGQALADEAPLSIQGQGPSDPGQFDTGRNFSMPNAVSDIRFGVKGVPYAVSPDGRTIYLGLADEKKLVSHANGGGQIANFPGAGAVSALAISADGKTLVSGSLDGDVFAWSTTTGDRIATLGKHPRSVLQIVFSRDGSHIVSQCAEVIQVYNLKQRQAVASSRHPFGQRLSLEISADNAKVLVGTGAGLHVAAANKLEFEATRPLTDTFAHIKFADPKTLAALGSDGPSIWEWPSLRPLKKARTSADLSGSWRLRRMAGSSSPAPRSRGSLRPCLRDRRTGERCGRFMPGLSLPTRMPDHDREGGRSRRDSCRRSTWPANGRGRTGNSDMDLDVRRVGTKYSIVIAVIKDGMTGRAHCRATGSSMRKRGSSSAPSRSMRPMPVPLRQVQGPGILRSDARPPHPMVAQRPRGREPLVEIRSRRNGLEDSRPAGDPGSRGAGLEGGSAGRRQNEASRGDGSRGLQERTTPRRRPPIEPRLPTGCCASGSRRRTIRSRATLSSRRRGRSPRRPANGRLRRTRSIGSTSPTRSIPWPCARRRCRFS